MALEATEAPTDAQKEEVRQAPTYLISLSPTGNFYQLFYLLSLSPISDLELIAQTRSLMMRNNQRPEHFGCECEEMMAMHTAQCSSAARFH